MQIPAKHFFLCNSFRLTGEAQGMCNKKKAVALLQYLNDEIISRGMDAMVSSTGCLKACEKGPVMIVQPDNVWYGEVTEERIDEVLDGIENGELPAEGRLG
ncbi:MAG TPA: (2Fe-2S) ferredoxin domain-containing protein [Fibrobacteraceae bacterium]|nr:(2Fe-2S) ferredoxin domain-containing protein [Fibrobacteraceae bacterium]